MKMNKLIASVAVVTAGVFIAGYLMNTFRDVSIVGNAIDGFDS